MEGTQAYAASCMCLEKYECLLVEGITCVFSTEFPKVLVCALPLHS